MSLDFLKQIKIDETAIPAAKKSSGGGGHRKEWNPTIELSLRVWKDGSVFPSAGLVERFELDYAPQPKVEPPTEFPEADDAKPTEKWIQPGNALDVFSTVDFPAFQSPKPFILANITTKAAGRADLFAQVERDEQGEPKTTVMTQGSNSFGKNDLIPMIKEVYGIEIGDQVPYVDLVFIGQDGEKAMKHFAVEKGFAFVPKTVSRGTEKGKPTVQRREDPWLFILLPATELGHPAAAPMPKKKKESKAEAQAKLTVQAGAEPELQN